MNLEQTERWYEKAISLATDQFMAQAYCNQWQRIYLWCERGDIAAAPDKPDGMELVYAGAVPMNLNRDGVRAWVWEKCRRAPCMPLEGGPL
jgi:hypothetical protein